MTMPTVDPGAQNLWTTNHAVKVTVAGAVTYVALAPIGTLQATALWQAKRITVAGADTVVEFADGNANFDNVATNLALLVYA